MIMMTILLMSLMLMSIMMTTMFMILRTVLYNENDFSDNALTRDEYYLEYSEHDDLIIVLG
jgi:hypothetical protein